MLALIHRNQQHAWRSLSSNQRQSPVDANKRHRPRLRRTRPLKQVQRPHIPRTVSLILKADPIGVLR